jgi:hypothetical protein
LIVNFESREMKKIAFALFLSVGFVLPVSASDMYIGLKLGSAKHDISVSGYSETVGAVGFLGGYKLNKNVALEAEVTSLGALLNDTYKISAVSVSVVGSLEVGEKASVFGRLGGAATREANSSGSLVSNATGITLGFGGQYDINQAVSLRLGWDRYTYGGTNGYYEGKAGITSVSALYNF